ncbi:unnamed protein product [Malus baccata var. baccata]
MSNPRIPNLILSREPTPLTKHPNLRYTHFVYVLMLHRPTFYAIQHRRPYCRPIKFSLELQWHTTVTQHAGCTLPLHPSRLYSIYSVFDRLRRRPLDSNTSLQRHESKHKMYMVHPDWLRPRSRGVLINCEGFTQGHRFKLSFSGYK